MLSWILGEAMAPVGTTYSLGADTEKHPVCGTDADESRPHPDGGALRRLRETTAQLLEALQALHGGGVVHADVKPSNVLVRPDGKVLLSDFGLAVMTSDIESSTTGEIVGSIPYMAPEQAESRRPTAAADLYAVGVMIYEVLAGRRPFMGEPLRILANKARKDAPPVRSHAPDAPEDLADLADSLLRREPEERPSAEEALLVLRGGPEEEEPELDRTVVMVPVAQFVGRNAELAVLRGASARRGRQRTVLVSGRSGIGKSHLIRHFASELRNDGWWVLRGRCHPAENLPFKALDGVVDALSHHLASLPGRAQREVAPRHTGALFRLFPVLERVAGLAEAPRNRLPADPVLVQRQGFAALRELFARLAERRPVAVWIDDLQWGDIDSLPLLRELLREPDPPPLLLLVSFRAEDRETSPLLTRLLDRGRPGTFVDEIQVGPLSDKDSRALATGLLRSMDADEASLAGKAIAGQAGGSPFLLGEMARFVAHGHATGPELLGDVVTGRLDELTEDEQRLLGVVAVAGQPLSEWVAWAAAESGPTGIEVVRSLGEASLLRVSEGPSGRLLDAYHDRIRETLLERIAGEELRSIHRHIAVAMRDVPDPDPEALLEHWLGAGERAHAADAALKAAGRAEEQLAFERAAALLERCIELEPSSAPLWELRDRRARCLANAGLGLEAAEQWETAALELQRTDDVAPDLLRLRSLACEFRLRWMDLRGAGAPLREVLRAVRIRVPGSTGGRVLAALALRTWIRLRGMRHSVGGGRITEEQHRELEALWRVFRIISLVNPLLSDVLGLRYVLRALPSGDPSAMARAFCQEVGYGSMLGSERYLKGVEARLATTAELAEKSGDPHDLALVEINSGVVGMCTSDWRRLAEAGERAAARWETECVGEQWYVALGRAWSALGYTWLGELATSRSMIEAGIAEAERRGDGWCKATYWLGESTIALLAVEGGEARVRALLQDARGTLGPQDAGWVQSAYNVQSLALVVSEVLLDLWEDDALGAWHRLSGEWGAVRRSGYLLCRFIREWARFRLGGAAVAASATGGPKADQQRRVAGRQAKVLAKDKGRIGEPLSHLLRGALAAQAGDVEQARTHLVAAEGGFDRLGLRGHLAATRARMVALGMDDRRTPAQRWFIAEGVRDRERFCRVMAPGFP